MPSSRGIFREPPDHRAQPHLLGREGALDQHVHALRRQLRVEVGVTPVALHLLQLEERGVDRSRHHLAVDRALAYSAAGANPAKRSRKPFSRATSRAVPAFE